MQFAQAKTQSKIAKELALSTQTKIVFKKFPNISKKIIIHRHTARQIQQTMTRKLNTEKAYSDMTERRPAGNSTLAIGGVPSPLDSFVVAESSVLRTNFCAKKPAHRQSAKR